MYFNMLKVGFICRTIYATLHLSLNSLTHVSPNQTMHMLEGKHFEIAGLVVEKYTGMMKNSSMLFKSISLARKMCKGMLGFNSE